MGNIPLHHKRNGKKLMYKNFKEQISESMDTKFVPYFI
jgi:hypothetical protein